MLLVVCSLQCTVAEFSQMTVVERVEVNASRGSHGFSSKPSWLASLVYEQQHLGSGSIESFCCA